MLGRIGNELFIGTEAVILLGNPLLVRASYPIIGVYHTREKSRSVVDLRWLVIQGIHDFRTTAFIALTMRSLSHRSFWPHEPLAFFSNGSWWLVTKLHIFTDCSQLAFSGLRSDWRNLLPIAHKGGNHNFAKEPFVSKLLLSNHLCEPRRRRILVLCRHV